MKVFVGFKKINRNQDSTQGARMMKRNPSFFKANVWITAWIILLAVGGCSKAYYGTMEKVGIHKRDILVDRVESARDAQSHAQEQFKSALEQFQAVFQIQESDLKAAYEKLNAHYEDSEDAAKRVSERIDKVESVAEALFKEWEEELALYQRSDLREASQKKLKDTQTRYSQMLASMQRAEKSMEPVLLSLRDNVLFLKHNLNAQAIGSLRTEFTTLKGEIDGLIKSMNEAIEHSNQFIADLKQ
jgi:DNA repair exonuclease SbcCD ATPase subunit